MRNTLALLAALALTLNASRAFAADESLAEAKALFAAASFDGALAALDRLETTNAASPEALEYKALCLLALGRTADAQKTTETLVLTLPTFAPGGEDRSPRFVELLTETRRRIVPAVARRLFGDARDQFRAKNSAEAKRIFQEVSMLASDPVWRDVPEAEDLRTLASGFLELLEGAAASSASVSSPASAGATTPAAAPLAAAASPAFAEVQPPTAISQAMPKWVAPDPVSAITTFHGAIKVLIGADGRVVAVSIATPTHATYDQQLLSAARNWVYKPATRSGQPIEVEKVVEFYLRPK
jgi:TonB family protein